MKEKLMKMHKYFIAKEDFYVASELFTLLNEKYLCVLLEDEYNCDCFIRTKKKRSALVKLLIIIGCKYTMHKFYNPKREVIAFKL